MQLESGVYGLFIDGKVVPSESGRTFEVTDPSTGQVCATVAQGDQKDIDRAVNAARRAFESGVWSKRTPEERAQVLENIAKKAMERAQEIASLEIQSSGATIRRMMGADILGVVEFFLRTARNVREFPHKEIMEALPIPGPSHTMMVREPVGVCAAIAPFNFPLMLAVWKVAPALAMGNSIVVKPASYTPLTALLLGQICKEAGVPDGVVNVVPGPGSTAGESLAGHPGVDKVAFTGSTVVGRRIMQLASTNIKKVTLELGGKSPNILLEDADLDIAVPGSLFAFLMHNGQVCESGTRLFVPEKIHDEVVERMVAMARKLKIGNPWDMNTDMGPVVSKSQQESILKFIEDAKKEGAKLATGGNAVKPEGYEGGYYVEPTIFTNVKNDMRIAQEEVFGPVLSVIKYKDLEEAIAMANDTIYGLAGGVWTRDVEKGYQVAARIRAGTVWVNEWHMLRSDSPFGGYKQSGIGRENGKVVLEEYSQVKSLHISYTLDRKHKIFYDRLLNLQA